MFSACPTLRVPCRSASPLSGSQALARCSESVALVRSGSSLSKRSSLPACKVAALWRDGTSSRGRGHAALISLCSLISRSHHQQRLAAALLSLPLLCLSDFT